MDSIRYQVTSRPGGQYWLPGYQPTRWTILVNRLSADQVDNIGYQATSRPGRQYWLPGYKLIRWTGQYWLPYQATSQSVDNIGYQATSRPGGPPFSLLSITPKSFGIEKGLVTRGWLPGYQPTRWTILVSRLPADQVDNIGYQATSQPGGQY